MTTPLWVSLVIAGLGLAGTLLAGLLTQLLQARHERERLALVTENEDRHRWAATRAELYAELLAGISEWRTWARSLRYSAPTVPSAALRKPPDGRFITHDAERILAQIDLVGTPAVRSSARGLWLWVATSSFALAEGGRSEKNRDEFMRGVEDSYSECVAAMREDLGVRDVSSAGR